MARLPRNLTEGVASVPTVVASPQAFSGGVTGFAQSFGQRAFNFAVDAMERDAALRTTEALAGFRSQATARFAELEASEDPETFSQSFLSEFDTLAAQAGENVPAIGRSQFEARLANLRVDFEDKARRSSTAALLERRIQSVEQGNDSSANLLISDPSQFQSVLEERIAAIRSVGFKPNVETEQIDDARELLAGAAITGLIQQDPREAIAVLEAGELDDQITPKQKSTLLSRANAEITRRDKARERAERRANREELKQTNRELAALTIRADEGDLAEEEIDALHDQGFFDNKPGAEVTLRRILRRGEEERAREQAKIEGLERQALAGGSFSQQQTDALYASRSEGVEDPEDLREITNDIVLQTRNTPSVVKSRVVQGERTDDPTVLAEAVELDKALRQAVPPETVIETGAGNRVNLTRETALSLNISSQQAAEIVLRQEGRAREDVQASKHLLKVDASQGGAKLDRDEIDNALDDIDAVHPGAAVEYDRAYKQAILQGATPDIAQNVAKDIVGSRYGETEFAEGGVKRFPIDRYLPPARAIQARQAVDVQVRNILVGLGLSALTTWDYSADRQTEAELRSTGLPTYQLFILDEGGNWRILPQRLRVPTLEEIAETPEAVRQRRFQAGKRQEELEEAQRIREADALDRAEQSGPSLNELLQDRESVTNLP